MAKIRDQCHITGKYRGSAHKDCNINVKLDHNIPIVLHNRKKLRLPSIIEELGKFNLKVNVIPNGLEKYLSLSISDKLALIDSVRFLSSSLDSLIKHLSKYDFKHLCQEFANNLLYI